MNAREHLHTVTNGGVDAEPAALRYLLAREAEREATPPASDGCQEVNPRWGDRCTRETVHPGSHRSFDADHGWSTWEATPPADPAPVVGDRLTLSEAGVRASGVSRQAQAARARVVTTDPDSTPDAPPAPAPGEDAVEALARALVQFERIPDPVPTWEQQTEVYREHMRERARVLLDVLGAVPGYGPTSAGVGAGEVGKHGSLYGCLNCDFVPTDATDAIKHGREYDHDVSRVIR